ncbi:recombinase family protein [Gemmobacter lutimaris]|uniref:Recombinase family protein n=2 Tax=Gemmobacter lutimaris TaxID=2306023 RepID=A0A398BL22_9RHOB|nr:recombinase family protein [Gemmobacter lutimaris]
MREKMALRAAIYARYSSDMQSAASITDQVRICRRLAEERGWQVVEVFADEAISGATHLRPGFQAMQQAAMAGQFDVLVAEALDRLSRDQEHIAGLHKRMRFLGVEIFTKGEGPISEMHVGLGGTMSAIFLRHLAEKTHRGLEGRVKQGKSAGGISYGYRLDRQPLPDGTHTTGDRVIDPAEAGIVRRIFAEYDRGLSARSIAIGLNKDGIAPPRSGGKGSGTWSFSTISGNWQRGTGILNNSLYVGKLVWNRQHFVKDPDSGKRQARMNPETEWITEEVPHLRIIDDALWTRVKQRQGAIREDILTERAEDPGAPKIERGHRPRYLLSGLLTCGCCGAGYIMISDTRYGCAAARNRGTCANRKTIARKDVESRVLNGLQTRLMHPELIREYIATWQQEMQKERLESLAARGEQERRLAKVLRDIENIVTAITEGMFHPSMKAKMDALEGERADLEAKLAALPEPEPVAIHPGLAETYARKVTDLAAALNDPEARPEAADLLRGLIESVTLTPDTDAPNGHVIELRGELGAILSLCGNDVAANANARRGAAGVRQVTVVAGAGFEPAAFRL